MTPRQQDLTRRIAWGAVLTAFSVGGAWTTVQARVAAVERAQEQAERNLADYKQETNGKLDKILSRVSAIYCAQVPQQIRAGCQ